MEENVNEVVEQKTQKNLFKLSLPIFFEMLLLFLMGIVDTLMLSGYGDDAVAAAGNANRLLGLLGVTLNIVAVGVGVVVSQYIGSKMIQKAKDTVKIGLYVNFAFGFILVILLRTFNGVLFDVLSIDPSIRWSANSYLQIAGTGLIFLSITNSASQALRSFGKGHYLMIVVLLSNIINILLNYILIYGHLGFPELGVSGAATSTLICRSFTAVMALILLFKLLGVKILNYKMANPLEYLRKIFKVGIPSAFENIIYSVAQVVILIYVNKISKEAAAAKTYVDSIITITLMFTLAVGTATQIIVGYYVGEKDEHNAYKRPLRTFVFTLPIVVSLSLLYLFFGENFMRIFSSNEDVVSFGTQALRVMIFLEIGRLSNIVFLKSLQAAGDVIFPVIIGVISLWFILIPNAYFLSSMFGFIGIYIALAFDEFLRGMLGIKRWLSCKWKGKSLVHDDDSIITVS